MICPCLVPNDKFSSLLALCIPVALPRQTPLSGRAEHGSAAAAAPPALPVSMTFTHALHAADTSLTPQRLSPG